MLLVAFWCRRSVGKILTQVRFALIQIVRESYLPMKKLSFFVFSIVAALSVASGSDLCSKYYPMEEGVTFQYTNYNKKGKEEGFVDYKISKVTESNGETKATLSIQYSDKKGKAPFEMSYGMTCTGNGLKIDFESLFPVEMREQYEGMGVGINLSGTDIDLPNDMEVGQALADANVDIAVNMGMMKMKISVGIRNRIVEKRESITTAAGTFDCLVISEVTSTKVMMKKVEMTSKIWLAEGVGMVRQESYSKKGKLESRTELSKFNK